MKRVTFFMAFLSTLLFVLLGMFLAPLADFLSPLGPFLRMMISTFLTYGIIKVLCNLADLDMNDCNLAFKGVSGRGIGISLVLIAAFFFLRTGGKQGQWKLNDAFLAMSISNAIACLCSSFCSGITEEMFFRGYLTALSRRCWGKWLCIWLPTVFFVLGHTPVLGKNVSVHFSKILLYGSLSVLLTILTYKSKSIGDGAFVHIIWNVFVSGDDIISVSDTLDTTAVFTYVTAENNPIFVNPYYLSLAIVVGMIVLLILVDKRNDIRSWLLQYK